MDLLDTALRVRANAHAPYSGFKVGAAIRCPDGSVFAGCNVENVAYPEGTCAEAGAIAAMVAAGAREIAEVLVVADSDRRRSPPAAAAARSSPSSRAPEAPVILAGLGGELARTTVGGLLPGAFGAGAHGAGRAMTDLRAAAARALACLDLTNLDEACDAAAIDALCARARTPHGPVAAVCIWPRFVAQARDRARRQRHPRRDRGQLPRRRRRRARRCATATRQVIVDGADEIDMVVPWRALAAGRPEAVAATVYEVKDAAGSRTLKAILETGELGGPGADPPRRRRGAGRRRRLPEDLDRQGPGQRHPRGRGDPARRRSATPAATSA